MSDMELFHKVAEERRSNDSIALLLLQDIMRKLLDIDERLTTHMETETSELAAEITKLMTIAFPASDPSGHRAYHEAQMKAILDRAAFWKKLREEVMTKGIIGLLGLAAIWVWAGFVKGPK